MKTIRSILSEVKSDELKEKLLTIYDAIEDRLKAMPASTKYHQNWKGGLYDHTCQVMTIALDFYEKRKRDFMMKINRDDVILTTFLHDFDKLDKYAVNPKADEKGEHPFIWNYKKEAINSIAQIIHYLVPYNLQLKEKHLNALTFSHGGWTRDRGQMNALATVLHCADLWSTRILTNKE